MITLKVAWQGDTGREKECKHHGGESGVEGGIQKKKKKGGKFR